MREIIEADIWLMPEELRNQLGTEETGFTGWSKWNPNNARCSDDGLSDCDGLLEFYWCNGKMTMARCPKCGKEKGNAK